MLLTQRAPIPLEIIVPQYTMAFLTTETMRVEFPSSNTVRLHVLSFDASITIIAQGVIELVVVPRAVGVVVPDVEIRAGKGGAAGFAHEAGFVVAAG